MPKPFEEWTVLPHGKLTRVDDNLLSVVGQLEMPLGEYPRRMTVVHLNDGRLVIYSAISLNEDEMAALESFGEPAYLIVPNELHRLDAKTWKERYPHIVVVAPSGVREKVSEVVTVEQTKTTYRLQDGEPLDIRHHGRQVTVDHDDLVLDIPAAPQVDPVVQPKGAEPRRRNRATSD